jgi:carbonic anhydrase
MKLFEAIIDANHRAVAGDASAGLHPAEYAESLPVVALTCIDPRLSAYFPNALALPSEQFIWLRNAGNIITGPLSSTMRSLSLACAVKGGREIAVIGHTDCQVAKTTTSVLLDKLKELGVDRSRLPDNLNEFFGTFGSERQNVLKACDYVRSSPLIGPKIPVHGLLLNIETGRLDWVVNGYETLAHPVLAAHPALAGAPGMPELGAGLESLGNFKDFVMGEMKFPEMKIGEAATKVEEEIKSTASNLQSIIQPVIEPSQSAAQRMVERYSPKPPPIKKKAPLPPPIRPRADFKQ